MAGSVIYPDPMLTKILFTITVIVGVMLFFRMKGAGVNSSEQGRGRTVKSAEPSEAQKMFRQGAWLFLILMSLSALSMVVFELGDQYATMSVHVINTRTGERVTYQAEQKEIKPNHFTTLEGRKVYLADVERMEVEPQ